MISLLNQIICSPGQGNLRTTSWLYGSLEKVKITEIDRFNQVKVMHGRAMDGEEETVTSESVLRA